MRFLMAMAIFPAFLLMMYIRRLDKIEQEPKELIIKILIFGGLTTISAVILELIGGAALKLVAEETSTVYIFLECFFVIAAAEELGKLVVLRLTTWKNPNFNYTYDAIVYAVAASLGFATVENVLYVVLNGGVSTAILRALTAVPGHAIFGVFMGCHYGLAKRAECWGEHGKKTLHMLLAYLMPVLIHGFYDFTLMVGNWLMILVFFVFYITVLIIAFLRVRKMSREDAPIGFHPKAGVMYTGTPADYLNADGADLMRQNAYTPPPAPPQTGYPGAPVNPQYQYQPPKNVQQQPFQQQPVFMQMQGYPQGKDVFPQMQTPDYPQFDPDHPEMPPLDTPDNH